MEPSLMINKAQLILTIQVELNPFGELLVGLLNLLLLVNHLLAN